MPGELQPIPQGPVPRMAEATQQLGDYLGKLGGFMLAGYFFSASSAASGASYGAAMGVPLGPIGIAAGGTIGGAIGFITPFAGGWFVGSRVGHGVTEVGISRSKYVRKTLIFGKALRDVLNKSSRDLSQIQEKSRTLAAIKAQLGVAAINVQPAINVDAAEQEIKKWKEKARKNNAVPLAELQSANSMTEKLANIQNGQQAVNQNQANRMALETQIHGLQMALQENDAELEKVQAYFDELSTLIESHKTIFAALNLDIIPERNQESIGPIADDIYTASIELCRAHDAFNQDTKNAFGKTLGHMHLRLDNVLKNLDTDLRFLSIIIEEITQSIDTLPAQPHAAQANVGQAGMYGGQGNNQADPIEGAAAAAQPPIVHAM